MKTTISLTGVLIGLFAGVSNAAVISWGAVSVFNDFTDVNANGLSTTVSAGANYAGTVNGVLFTDQQPGTLSSFANSGAFGVGTFLNATGNAAFDALVGTQNWNDPHVTSNTISLSGLTVGQAYRIQAIFVDDRAGNATQSGTLGDLDGGTASAVITRGNLGNKTSGNTIYGDFTADADGTQEFTVGGGNLQICLPDTCLPRFQSHPPLCSAVLACSHFSAVVAESRIEPTGKRIDKSPASISQPEWRWF